MVLRWAQFGTVGAECVSADDQIPNMLFVERE